MTTSYLSEANNLAWPDTVQGTQQLYNGWAKTYDVSMIGMKINYIPYHKEKYNRIIYLKNLET